MRVDGSHQSCSVICLFAHRFIEQLFVCICRFITLRSLFHISFKLFMFVLPCVLFSCLANALYVLLHWTFFVRLTCLVIVYLTVSDRSKDVCIAHMLRVHKKRECGYAENWNPLSVEYVANACTLAQSIDFNSDSMLLTCLFVGFVFQIQRSS